LKCIKLLNYKTQVIFFDRRLSEYKYYDIYRVIKNELDNIGSSLKTK